MPPVSKTNILGVNISAINMTMAMDAIEQWIAERDPHYVCCSNVHSIMESWHDPALRRIHNEAGLVTPDGMPLVWINRLRGQTQVRRVYGPDLMLVVCAHSMEVGWRHFFYGGAEGVSVKLAERLQERFPGLPVAGTYAPPFRPLTAEEDATVIAQINASNADIVWVGLGMPKQEHWMAEHVGKLEAPVLIGVGAAFDFHSGIKKQAPAWMQQAGFEWLFRMLTEPRRLGKRYLRTNPHFLGLLLLNAMGLLPDDEEDS